MARHPTSSRVHRDKDVPDDVFVSSVERSVAWAKANQRLLTIAGYEATPIDGDVLLDYRV